VTTPVKGVFGFVAGNGSMIACAPPLSAGVRGPGLLAGGFWHG